MVPNAKNRRGNSTYRLEALGSLHTYKRAHAVTWASTYHPVCVEIS